MSPTNEELKQRRQAIGATLQDVANETGVSVSAVWMWEGNKREPHGIIRQAWIHAIEDLEARFNAKGPEAA